MKLSAKKLTLTVSTTMLLALANSQAIASPRLCGYIAVDNPNKMGILAEFSDNDSLYHQKCDQALDESWKKIQSNAQLQSQNWRKITRTKCYDVGKQGFLNNGDSADLLCNNMDSDNGYKITKIGSAGATFEKQAGSNPGGVGGVANDIDNGVNQSTKAIKSLF
ncbi:hypothetical protein MCEORH2_01176 [Methylophilaceae bacterium]